MMRTVSALALLFAFTLPAFGDDTAWRKEVEDFRKQRVEDLKKEDGWFTLVGLAWLEEGENRFGSDPANPVVPPRGQAMFRGCRAQRGSYLLHGGPFPDMAQANVAALRRERVRHAGATPAAGRPR